MEILAPVGGQEQLLAAVRSGADAIYLGAKGFNARRNAENFTETSLQDAVAYCHARGVRVHVTLNTLVTDDEMPALLDTLREIAESGADAVIVQDLAVARAVRTHCPALAMHASTQMTIHNASGARMLSELGFSRAVLARELTLDEIAAIHAATTIELETFVHGALCMSVSGACYLSSLIGGRSGNRGLCAQPCRLDFRTGGRGYALSLKDLSALSHTNALQAAGVCSLKIEGRMKRPEYVAAAVTACRQALAGEPYDLETLQAVFSRGGFTDGYLTGKRNLSMFGTRTHADVQASQRVLGQLAGLYQRERAAVPVTMRLTLRSHEAAALHISDGVHTVDVTGSTPEIAKAAPTDQERAWRSLSKTGESPFSLASLTVDNDDNLMLPAAALNAMRRDALSALLGLRETPHPHPFIEAPMPDIAAHEPAANPPLRVRLASTAQLWDDLAADKIILPTSDITPPLVARFGASLIAEIPALVFPSQEAAMAARLREVKAMGVTAALCHNLGAIRMAQDAGLTPHGGYGLNILNTLSLDAYAALGLADATVSFELHAQKIRRLGGSIARGALAYGHLPLMQLRCCPGQTANGCAGCDGHPTLTDRTGATFTLQCQQRVFSTLLNAVPLDLAGETLPGVDFLTLRFTTEPADECRRILDRFLQHVPPEGPRTRGLYHRTLQ